MIAIACFPTCTSEQKVSAGGVHSIHSTRRGGGCGGTAAGREGGVRSHEAGPLSVEPRHHRSLLCSSLHLLQPGRPSTHNICQLLQSCRKFSWQPFLMHVRNQSSGLRYILGICIVARNTSGSCYRASLLQCKFWYMLTSVFVHSDGHTKSACAWGSPSEIMSDTAAYLAHAWQRRLHVGQAGACKHHCGTSEAWHEQVGKRLTMLVSCVCRTQRQAMALVRWVGFCTCGC